jgi:nicotinate-nucleotide adenylyltransferase
MTRLGIFGGTFDPPHYGHLILAEEVAHTLALDQVRFVPAGQPPHKALVGMSELRHRVAMTRLAIAGNARFALDLTDVERAGPSYSVDLVATLAGRWPTAALWFVMGADSLVDLPAWHQPQRLIEIVRLAVATRPGSVIDWAALERAVPGVRARVDLAPTIAIGIAGRDLRRRVAQGRPIRYQTPSAVQAYIIEHGLYGGDVEMA